MIGPNAELKAALLAAIPTNLTDPRFEEKMLTVNEVMLEIALHMQEKYKLDLEEMKAQRDKYKFLYEREFDSHSTVLGIMAEFFPPGADIRDCLMALTGGKRYK
jgi:hypothetical protein